jgi:hypothetical protein
MTNTEPSKKAYSMEESNGLIVKWSINTIAVIGKTDASTSFSLSINAPN